MDGEQKKGMSKGCMVGLIVAGVILVIIIIGAISCWVFKDDLAKMGMVKFVDGVKTLIVTNPIEGVDTVQFNAVADGFVTRLNETELDLEKYSAFASQLQGFMSTKNLSAEDVGVIQGMMVDYFPDLGAFLPPAVEVDSIIVEDTVPSE
ncbi:MAG: hypothetical protein ACOYVF_11905 [Candidatus Zixiibacteriota bacterium]